MANIVVGKLPHLIQTAGTFGSINFTAIPCTVSPQTKFGVNATTTAFDAPATMSTFDGTYQPFELFAAGNVTADTISAGGHELAVQGPIAPLQIKLDDSTGNTGDVIVRTSQGPRWQPDYYSTYYNLADATSVNLGEGGTMYVVDPRNGFTQYAGFSLYGEQSTATPARFAFVKGLPMGRVWRVRVHVYADSSALFYNTFLDSSWDPLLTPYGSLQAVGAGTCSSNEAADLYSGSTHLYEFFTYDGGTTWYWTKLVGFQACG